jgi:hypothetical protein
VRRAISARVSVLGLPLPKRPRARACLFIGCYAISYLTQNTTALGYFLDALTASDLVL